MLVFWAVQHDFKGAFGNAVMETSYEQVMLKLHH